MVTVCTGLFIRNGRGDIELCTESQLTAHCIWNCCCCHIVPTSQSSDAAQQPCPHFTGATCHPGSREVTRPGVERCTDDGTIIAQSAHCAGHQDTHYQPSARAGVVFTNTGSITVMSSAGMTWRHYLTSPQHRRGTHGGTWARTSYNCGGLSCYFVLNVECISLPNVAFRAEGLDV